jgi:hypothetical protein
MRLFGDIDTPRRPVSIIKVAAVHLLAARLPMVLLYSDSSVILFEIDGETISTISSRKSFSPTDINGKDILTLGK